MPRSVVPALALLAVLAGCRSGDVRGDDFRGANVVVIGIDTLRADHVGAYGYGRPTTPRIDFFSQDAARFATAVSQSSWTLPAFASIFTGLVPSAHRAGEGKFPNVSRLDEAHATLATVLRAAGYHTASFVSNVWVSADVGMARGFDEQQQETVAEDAVDDALDWLYDRRQDPFFVFVHIIDPHQPWVPTVEDLAVFGDPAYRGPMDTYAGDANPQWTDADRRRIVDLYDGEVRWADRLTGRLLAALVDLHVYDRTIVIVVSDHGEELFDHDHLGHGHTLYDELLLVPLMIRFPGARLRGVVTRPVRTMDVFPTLLDALRMPAPPGVNGVSLMPLLRREASAPDTDVALSEYVCFGDDLGLESLRTPVEKLIFYPAAGRAALYDLAKDPHEQTDVAAQRQPTVAALRDRLAAETVPVQDGFHLTVQGGTEEGVLRVRLVTTTGFRDVTLQQAEPEDRFHLARGGRVLDLKLHLRTETRPVLRWDVDGVGFRTEQGGQLVVQRIALNGKAISPDQLSVGKGGAPLAASFPWRFDADTPGLVVSYPSPPAPQLDGRPHLQVDFVRRGDAPTTTVRPEALERLRALGYVQ